jgi:hypothetical protein
MPAPPPPCNRRRTCTRTGIRGEGVPRSSAPRRGHPRRPTPPATRAPRFVLDADDTRPPWPDDGPSIIRRWIRRDRRMSTKAPAARPPGQPHIAGRTQHGHPAHLIPARGEPGVRSARDGPRIPLAHLRGDHRSTPAGPHQRRLGGCSRRRRPRCPPGPARRRAHPAPATRPRPAQRGPRPYPRPSRSVLTARRPGPNLPEPRPTRGDNWAVSCPKPRNPRSPRSLTQENDQTATNRGFGSDVSSLQSRGSP